GRAPRDGRPRQRDHRDPPAEVPRHLEVPGALIRDIVCPGAAGAWSAQPRQPTRSNGVAFMSLQQRCWSVLGGSACLAALAIVVGMSRGTEARAEDKPSPPAASAAADPAVERAREQVKMLDDLYKNAVVSITRT